MILKQRRNAFLAFRALDSPDNTIRGFSPMMKSAVTLLLVSQLTQRVVMSADGSQGTIARGHGSQRRRIDSPAFNAGTVRSCGIQSGPRDTARPMLSVKKTSSKLTPGMARCTFGAVMPAGMMPRRKSTRVRVGISRTATRWNVCRLAVLCHSLGVYPPWWLHGAGSLSSRVAGLRSRDDHVALSRSGSCMWKAEELPRNSRLYIYGSTHSGTWASSLLNDPYSSNCAFVLFVAIMLLILGSSITLCLGTLPEFEQSAEIQQIEIICGVIFTVEFVARVLVWQGSLHLLLLDLTMWVDALSVLPMYIGLILSAINGCGDSADCLPTSLMLLRLLRLLRIFKVDLDR